MSPVLIDSIRQRMREHTTEQLLEMWVTNDRVTWSPEAFEAVKDILAERGQTELPPQNGPAPVGRTWSPFDRPESEYWMGWLRPVLWMGITVAILALVRAPLTVTALFQAILMPAGSRWTPLAWVPAVVNDLLLPGWLIVGSIGTLKLRRWGRTAVLLYAPSMFVLTAWTAAQGVWQFSVPERGPWLNAMIVANRLEVVVRTMVLPTILVLLLRRPEIRAVFLPPRGGFDVTLEGPVSAP